MDIYNNKQRIIILSVVIFVFLIIYLCFINFFVVRVGGVLVSENDIDLQKDIGLCYPGGDKETGNSPIYLINSVNNTIKSQVLRDFFGDEIADQELVKHKEKIEKNTKSPEVLECIKKILNEDEYLYSFIRPNYVDQKLQYLFMFSEKVNRGKRDYIQMIRNDLTINPKSEYLKLFNEIKINKREKKNGQNSEVTIKDFQFNKYLLSLKKGETYKNIIEDNYTFNIMKFENETKDYYIARIITVNKENYHDWYKKNTANIGIYFYNSDFLDLIRSKTELFWYQNIENLH